MHPLKLMMKIHRSVINGESMAVRRSPETDATGMVSAAYLSELYNFSGSSVGHPTGRQGERIAVGGPHKKLRNTEERLLKIAETLGRRNKTRNASKIYSKRPETEAPWCCPKAALSKQFPVNRQVSGEG